MSEECDVIVGGAVKRGGHHLLSPPATIRSALEAAGGLADATREMQAAGVITVRRPHDNRKVDVRRFQMSDTPTQWELFELQSGDAVIFQWHIDT